ncbi:PaaX family transcriptional regulator C-terminal domain-containing protein [soil metagenome]
MQKQAVAPSEARTREIERAGPASARSVLLTLLGEFMLASVAPIFTAPLLYTLAGVGVAEKAARQAIARAAAAGWIESERAGRRVSWRLSDRGRQLIFTGSGRLKSLRTDERAWDGSWMVVHVTLPESRRTDRLRLYRALSWIGFGNPTQGVWISPHTDRANEARRAIDELGLADHTLAFTAKSLGFGIAERDFVAQAWDLPAVALHYAELVARFSAVRPRSDDEVLFAHVNLVNALQRLPSVDPGLPLALLPPDWNIRREAAKLWALRDAWRLKAHARWKELQADAGS